MEGQGTLSRRRNWLPMRLADPHFSLEHGPLLADQVSLQSAIGEELGF